MDPTPVNNYNEILGVLKDFFFLATPIAVWAGTLFSIKSDLKNLTGWVSSVCSDLKENTKGLHELSVNYAGMKEQLQSTVKQLEELKKAAEQ